MRALEVKDGELEFGGDGERDVTQFSVKIDGHIFKMMTDGMYSAKVPSVVREILANAIDAQIKSGRNETVKVSLPTHFNSTFRVRDYGDGMDHVFVKTLYTQLGHSTKRDDNEQTGFFGMGSKSPFTITDQFQVTVFDGSRKRIYSAARAEDGIPVLDFVGAFPSTESSGVEVSIPVRSDLISEFETAIKASAFAYFDKNIEFNRDFNDGTHPLDWAKGNYKKLAEDVYTGRVERGSYATSQRFHIRQGFAVYPLEVNQLDLDVATSKMMHRLSGQSQLVYFDAPIGTFNVTPSREKIQYDIPSRENLRALLGTLMLRTLESVREQVKDVTTIREARLRLMLSFMKEREQEASYEISDALRDTNDVFPLFDDSVRANWARLQDKRLEEHDKIYAQAVADGDVELPLFVTQKMSSKVTVYEQHVDHTAKLHTASGRFFYSDNDIVGGASFSKSQRVTMDTESLVYVIPTATRYWQERVYKHASEVMRKRFGKFKGTYNTDIHVFRVARAQADVAAATVAELSEQVFDVVYTENDLPQYVPDRTTASIQRRTYSKTAVYVLRSLGSTYSWGWSKEKIEADQNEVAYYVTRKGIGSSVLASTDKVRDAYFNPSFDFGDGFVGKLDMAKLLSNADFYSVIEAARALGIIDPNIPVYRVTERQRDILIEDDDHPWVDVFEVIFDGAISVFKKEFVPHMKSSHRALAESTIRVPRVISSMVDEMFDLEIATVELEKGDNFFSVSQKFLRNANIFGNNGLFDVIDTMNNSEAIAALCLPAYVKHSRFPKGPNKTADERVPKIAVLWNYILADKPTFSVTQGLMETFGTSFVKIMDDLALLTNLDYIDSGKGHHVSRYLTASLNEPNVAKEKVPNDAGMQALVKEMRERFMKAKKSFIKHQKTTAKTQG